MALEIFTLKEVLMETGDSGKVWDPERRPVF